MKLFYVLVILIIFQSCSFDNKTGIWKNENSISNKDNDLFNEFKKISISEFKSYLNKKNINVRNDF